MSSKNRSVLSLSEGPASAEELRSVRNVTNSLRSGVCPAETEFDRFLPFPLRVASTQYWTPLAVALTVGQWIESFGFTRVIDVGSGVGKFCVGTALACNAEFVGLEHRASFVQTAQALARFFSVDDRVSFLHGTIGETPLPSADVYYFYNPFGENLFTREDQLDAEVELGIERFLRDVQAVEQLLSAAPEGVGVVTYNGFGGDMPRGYELVQVEYDLPCVLRFYRKLGPS